MWKAKGIFELQAECLERARLTIRKVREIIPHPIPYPKIYIICYDLPPHSLPPISKSAGALFDLISCGSFVNAILAFEIVVKMAIAKPERWVCRLPKTTSLRTQMQQQTTLKEHSNKHTHLATTFNINQTHTNESPDVLIETNLKKMQITKWITCVMMGSCVMRMCWVTDNDW